MLFKRVPRFSWCHSTFLCLVDVGRTAGGGAANASIHRGCGCGEEEHAADGGALPGPGREPEAPHENAQDAVSRSPLRMPLPGWLGLCLSPPYL